MGSSKANIDKRKEASASQKSVNTETPLTRERWEIPIGFVSQASQDLGIAHPKPIRYNFFTPVLCSSSVYLQLVFVLESPWDGYSGCKSPGASSGQSTSRRWAIVA